VRAAVVGLAAPVLAGGCLPAAATTEGHDVERLYTVFLAIAAVVWFIVTGLATFAILRYRRRGSDTALPVQTRGNTRLELAWTAIPTITILGLFGLTLVALDTVDVRRASSPTEITVTAFRWGWTFEYPASGVTVSGLREPGPEVAVPVGEPIRVNLHANDVIHAFFVPEFLFKRDAVPGQQNSFEFTVEDAGTYRGQCAEFCGAFHARMPFTVVAMPRSEFDAWLATRPSGPSPAASTSGAP
jgi:cytochrome c oxidase subunit 2